MKSQILSELIDLIFSEKPRNSEVIFIHAWDDLSEEMLAHVAKMYKQCAAKYIILNGLENYELYKPGFSDWKDSLTKNYGVSREAILAINPAHNTGEEARELMSFVAVRQIKSVLILSVPQHIVRAFLTDLGAMREKGLSLDLSCSTLDQVVWHERIKVESGSLNGSKEITTRLGRFGSEILRIIEYRKAVEEGNKNFVIASLEEGLAYLKIKK